MKTDEQFVHSFILKEMSDKYDFLWENRYSYSIYIALFSILDGIF